MLLLVSICVKDSNSFLAEVARHLKTNDRERFNCSVVSFLCADYLLGSSSCFCYCVFLLNEYKKRLYFSYSSNDSTFTGYCHCRLAPGRVLEIHWSIRDQTHGVKLKCLFDANLCGEYSCFICINHRRQNICSPFTESL